MGLRETLCAKLAILLIGLPALLGSQATPTLSITDDNYGQATKDFFVPVGTNLTNTVTWTATNLVGRSGFLFLRFDTAPTVELLPADVTVSYLGSPVPAIKVGFNSLEFNPVVNIADLGTGGTVAYSVTFNKALMLNNSRIGIFASGQPFVASNELSHQINVLTPAHAVQMLMSMVQSMGLPRGTQLSLLAKLEVALMTIIQNNPLANRAAVNQLQAFILQVSALQGKKLTPEQTASLTAFAQLIMRSLSSPS